jgi:hypothetical protein
VLPTHKAAEGVLTTGSVFTVTEDVVLLQPVDASMNVNVIEPDETPVATPAFVTVATVLLLLTQVPPTVGLKVIVLPTHKVGEGVLTIGIAPTVTEGVVLPQPVAVSVNVNVIEPADTPVTSPAFVTVAIAALLLTQVPPTVGLRVIVLPTHKVGEGVLTTGSGFTVTEDVVLLQPVAASVNVNVIEPAETPVATPVFVTVAIVLLLLVQVPPTVGLRVIVLPTHKVGEGVLTIGIAPTVTEGVVLLQPVAVSVNVNVIEPADTPVTNPAFVTVATAALLLNQVPPTVGLRVIVLPTHKVGEGVLTTGSGFTVTEDVVLLQPVAVSVNVNVIEPADTPVTNPAFVTVATAALLLNQVPPTVGLRVIVLPAQSAADGELTTGIVFTVTEDVVLLQPVAVSVNVNVIEPAETPVAIPALVTVATVLLLLTQVPPTVGLRVIVLPTHKVGEGVLTMGCWIATEAVVLLQPVVVSKNVNVTEPAATPVTNPALVTVAIALLLLDQVPPTVGLKVIVLPTQSAVNGVLTTGRGFTVTADVVLLQPVAVSVKVNVIEPVAMPVATPALVTVATVLSLLTQVPPTVGLRVKVLPTHRVGEGVLTTGIVFTVTRGVVLLQPVAVSVNVNVIEPADTPVTRPAFVTVATAALLLIQVPPTVGLRVIVLPTHKVGEGVLTMGSGVTVIATDPDMVAGTQPFTSVTLVKV